MRDTIDPLSSFDTRMDKLLGRLRALEGDLSVDPNSQLLGKILDDACLAVTDSANTKLHEIDAALARILDGQYGFCECCGTQISLARLEKFPATAICDNCAKQA